MTSAVLAKLLAIVVTVALGWLAARQGWLGAPGGRGTGSSAGSSASADDSAARVLGNIAFFLFVPALLFRTTVRLDLAHMPWRTLEAFFVPTLIFLIAVYLASRRGAARGSAAPATRAITASFGNSVQVGIPVAAAVFGEAGLAIHIALVSLHALMLLTVLTALVETDLARARPGGSALVPTLRLTLRNTLIHPVVLPVLGGLLWNLTGLGLNQVVDEGLATLGSAVVPVCLVLIGVTLAAHGIRGRVRDALGMSVLKLLALPGLVLVVAHFGFGLTGLPLDVVVMMSALPVGSNALIFAQRYGALQAEATAAIVLSTVAFAATAGLWLAVLHALRP